MSTYPENKSKCCIFGKPKNNVFVILVESLSKLTPVQETSESPVPEHCWKNSFVLQLPFDDRLHAHTTRQQRVNIFHILKTQIFEKKKTKTQIAITIKIIIMYKKIIP